MGELSEWGREGWGVCVEGGGYMEGRVGAFGHVDDPGAHVILSSVTPSSWSTNSSAQRLAMSTY